MNKLYVSNFPWDTTEDDLGQFFTQAGDVEKVEIIMDRDTNQSRGFGFVTMKTEEQARTALKALHGNELGGRDLTVRMARPEGGERSEKRPSIRQAQAQNDNPPSLSQQIEDFCLGECVVDESID